MSSVLVVGGAGYVGGYLVDLLQNKGYSVTVYDNLLYESIYLKPIDFIYGGVSETGRLIEMAKSFDMVIWLAAIVGDGACEIDKNLTHEVNHQSIVRFLEECKSKFIFMSTCSVYGANKEMLVEESSVNPLSTYAATKLAAEQHILKSGDHLCFRLGTLCGLGDTYSRIRMDLVANVLTKKATYGECLTIYGGEQWRPILHVKDVAHAVLFCLEKDITGLYNLSNSNWTISDLALEIKRFIPNVQIKRQEALFEDQRNYMVSCEKIAEKGWVPKHSLAEGILEIHKIFKERRVKDPNHVVYSNENFLKGQM